MPTPGPIHLPVRSVIAIPPRTAALSPARLELVAAIRYGRPAPASAFPNGVSPLGLLLGALLPTVLVAFSFMVL